jgi:hypothetical protein
VIYILASEGEGGKREVNIYIKGQVLIMDWGDTVKRTENKGKDLEVVLPGRKSSILDIVRGKENRTPR